MEIIGMILFIPAVSVAAVAFSIWFDPKSISGVSPRRRKGPGVGSHLLSALSWYVVYSTLKGIMGDKGRRR